ncbi:hypothetical protein [Halomontanus rarus]|uniref:hypothetical protein n=1 Tax=Halomontanus rarus TaxID=3034020 RepID=UPI0023E84D24|nr:hypothetical protein [Halovivax sp. TS33]
MCANFTDDDVGKSVVNANNDEIGIIAAVEHGTAHVEPDPGVTDTIKAKLGWKDTDDDTYPLQEGSVDHVTDDHVHLKSNLSGGTRTGTDTGTGQSAGGTTGTGTDTGMGDDRSRDSRRTDDDELIDTDIGDDTGDDELVDLGDDDRDDRDDRNDDRTL